jgi:predicted DNA-binding transcriptional regulator AlpA
MANELMAEAEAADLLGKKVQTLRKWAVRGQGPARIKIGKTVRYRMADLQAWLDSQRQDPAQRLAS